MTELSFFALPNFPDIHPHDDLARIIADYNCFQDGDIICIAQKVVSKAENRYIDLRTVTPSARAQEVAEQCAKDPVLVELILQESAEISRMRKGVIITRHRLGFVSANAGIDRSNLGKSNHHVLLLPQDPDASAQKIRSLIETNCGVSIAVIITDSHGRPHRLGTVGVAIGVSGIQPVVSKNGEEDRYGRILQATEIGHADEIAASASLLMGQAAEGTPVVVLRGLATPPTIGKEKAADINRPLKYDLYR